jgi:hypothetical protein
MRPGSAISPSTGANWAVAWIVPVGLGGVFLLLFSQANPLIED